MAQFVSLRGENQQWCIQLFKVFVIKRETADLNGIFFLTGMIYKPLKVIHTAH